MNRALPVFARPAWPAPAAALLLGLLAGCGGGGGESFEASSRPSFLSATVTERVYDGLADDLLTAGLGRSGLAGAAPAVSNPPTAAELRRLAIYNNYRAVLDITANGGYGRLYGPNVSIDGTVGLGEGRIAGREYIAYADDGTGRLNVTMMVQVPDSFNVARPCIVTGTSSGSRGVYGAIGSSGEWGLKRGCAVAYSDKGTGNGVHDLQNDTVNRQDGTRVGAATAGSQSNFTANLTAGERASFNAATPNRFAVKHAHSGQNPEKDWGLHTLQAVEFAFWILNERYSPTFSDGSRQRTIRPSNTLVIASSISNGGGAALAAAEIDGAGLIDAVVVSEPQVQLRSFASSTLSIQRGTAGVPRPATARTLVDYTTLANLLQPCAALAPAVAALSPFPLSAGAAAGVAANRCAALASNGLVAGSTTADQAADALAQLRAAGWEPESDLLHASHYQFATPAIATTYTNAAGRFRVSDNLCGYSFGAVDPVTQAPVAAAAAAVAAIFGTGNGVPPSAPIALVNNDSVGGPRSHAASVSASTGLADFSFDAALCQRNLWTSPTAANAQRVRAGVDEVRRTANLGGRPALIVHGRADTLVPANFTSRAYFGRNQQVEGGSSRLRYIEVTNAQHFDSFLGFGGYDTRFIPLHVYFNRALDAMWAHLTVGTPLPPSQVVRTTPRGGAPGAAPEITAANLPPIASSVAPTESIAFVNGNTVFIPD